MTVQRTRLSTKGRYKVWKRYKEVCVTCHGTREQHRQWIRIQTREPHKFVAVKRKGE